MILFFPHGNNRFWPISIYYIDFVSDFVPFFLPIAMFHHTTYTKSTIRSSSEHQGNSSHLLSPEGLRGKRNTVRIGNREAVAIGAPGVQCSAVGAEKGWQLGAYGTNNNRYNPLDQPFGDQPLHHPVWMTGSQFFKTPIGGGLLLYHISVANMEMSMINSKWSTEESGPQHHLNLLLRGS